MFAHEIHNNLHASIKKLTILTRTNLVEDAEDVGHKVKHFFLGVVGIYMEIDMDEHVVLFYLFKA